MDQNEVYEFICGALGAKPEKNKLIDEFNTLVEQDFVELARMEPAALENNPKLLLKLKAMAEAFKLTATFPMIYGKRVGAVGGGFSSGKSAFINSLIPENTIELVMGTTPTTAIPTFVTAGSRAPEITGITLNGGIFSITAELFKKIDRDFLSTLPFNIKDIIPCITISCPMEEKYFKNICLVDTPGYNPAGDSFASDDYNAASHHIRNADFLLWLVPVDAGTMPKSDIKFLQKLIDNGQLQDLYIVVNKADLRPAAVVDKVLEEIVETLEDEDIPCKGICAYSANKRAVQASLAAKGGLDIFQFLEQNNIQSRTYGDMNRDIDGVFDEYKDALLEQKGEFEEYLKRIKTIKSEMLKIDVENENRTIKRELGSLAEYFNIKEIDAFVEETNGLRKKFKACISRLENYKTYAEINTLLSLSGYLAMLSKKDNTDKTLKKVLLAQSEAIAMIGSVNYSGTQFRNILANLQDAGGKRINDIAVPLINSLSIHLNISDRDAAETKMREVCNYIIDVSEKLVEMCGEKAAFSNDKICSDFLEQIFANSNSVDNKRTELKDTIHLFMQDYKKYNKE